MERLSDRFGDVESTDLASALMETAKNAVEDNLQDYFSQLKDCTKDSFLEELDDFNIEVIYRRLAANSVAFMLISRCGLDANEFFDREDFADIVNFNTPATINAIGVATSDIAEMALREISQSIRNVQMAEKDQNRTFEQRTQALYDKGRQQPERSEYNEQNHLQQTGGLSYSRPNITDRARASAWQVRFDAQGLSGEEQASDLSQPADIGQAERASARGRADSTPEVGASDEAALSRAGRNRGTERESSDAVGRTDEQHPQPSGGSDTDRTDLQVSVAKEDEVRVNRYNDNLLEEITLLIEALVEQQERTGFSEAEDTLTARLQHQLLKLRNILKAQNQMLTQEKEQIKTLISDISHQIKTPVAAANTFAQLLGDTGLSDEERREYIATLQMSLEKLTFLTNSLIKMSRLESGIIRLKPEQSSLNDIVMQAVKTVYAKARDKNITITFDCGQTFEALLDFNWTAEAVTNVLDNAVKYTPSGGVVDLKITEYPSYLRLDVSDNGIGIPEEEQAKIFGRFYRGKQSAGVDGVGIGLYLTRDIVNKQNGYIKVASDEKGTIFSLFLKKV